MTQIANQRTLPNSSTGESPASTITHRRWRVRATILVLVGGALLVWQWKSVWPVFPNWRASVALQNRDAEAAAFWLQTAELGVNDHPETAFLQARCRRRLGDFSGVRLYLEKAYKCGVSRQRLEREEWLTMAQSGQMKEAEPHLPELLGSPRGDIHEICESFSIGYLRLHRYDNATEILDAWLADYPENSYALLLRARVLSHLRNFDLAEKDLRLALKISPDLAEAQYELAEELRTSKRPDEALPLYDKCLGDAKVATQARIGRCIVLKMLAQSDDARKQLGQIVAEHPDQAQAAYELGLLELEAGDAKPAVEHLQRVKQSDPNNFEVRYALAQALQMCDRRQEAEAEFAFVEVARRVAGKMRELTDKSRANPSNVEVRFELGQILFQLGNKAEGANWLHSVLEIAPGHVEARRMLDDYHSSMGPRPQPPKPEKQNR